MTEDVLDGDESFPDGLPSAVLSGEDFMDDVLQDIRARVPAGQGLEPVSASVAQTDDDIVDVVVKLGKGTLDRRQAEDFVEALLPDIDEAMALGKTPRQCVDAALDYIGETHLASLTHSDALTILQAVAEFTRNSRLGA